VVKLPGIVDVKKGQTLRFSADKTKLHLFDADGQTYRR
jgi:alpha-glucoside transport system ATP-binding protein